MKLRRLDMLRRTEDGFRIAEGGSEAARRRGCAGGEAVGGAGVSGGEGEAARESLRAVRVAAEGVVSEDERLEREGNRELRMLLWLFERDAAVRLLEAG